MLDRMVLIKLEAELPVYLIELVRSGEVFTITNQDGQPVSNAIRELAEQLVAQIKEEYGE